MACDYPKDPSEIRGGIESAACRLASGLVRHTDCEVITFSFVAGLARPERLVTEGGRIRIHRFPNRQKLRALIDYAGHRRAFARFCASVDPHIVHAQGEGLYASLAVRSGRPNVYTVHGLRLNELAMQRREIGALRYRLYASLVRRHHRRATHIVAINEYTRRHIAHLHTARVFTIRNAVDDAYFSLYDREAARAGEILLVGGVRRRKDILTAVRALAPIRRASSKMVLRIVGPVDAAYRAEVERCVRERGLGAHVDIRGPVTGEELLRHYRTADVLLLTSVEESSPICIVEAMAAGKPVVATDVGGISEMVEDPHSAILCPPGDDEAIADALQAIVSDRERRDRMGRHGHRLAQRDWSGEAVALETYRMYEEILDGR